MELTEAIRQRRTHKVFGTEPVDRETLEELFDLARWAPNHYVTNPWRFRVLGPQAVERLKRAHGDEVAARKLDRAPTLVAVTSVSEQGASDSVRSEDLMATACATYLVLLGATERGLASYWRTPAVLGTQMGRAALGITDDEQVVGLLHLGETRQEPVIAERAPVEQVALWLD